MKELDRLLSVLGQVEFLQEQRVAAEQLRDHLAAQEVIVSVIGQFKRGKSSVINAMLGEALLPVAIIPLTTVVTELRWGEHFHAQVNFADGRAEEIRRDQLADYCSEEKNPGNCRQVETVKIWTPSQPFGRGVVLVDTPGVGSVHQHNTDSSYAYVEKSDAVLFLLSVDSPVSETERAFLLRARQHAAKFFFGVNKADVVSPEDLDKFCSFCGNVLTAAMGSDVSLQPVSARTGAGIRSLIEELSAVLKGTDDGILEASIRKKLSLLQAQTVAKLSLAREAASIPGEELAARLDRVHQEQQRMEHFGEEVQVLTRHRTDQLVEQIKTELEHSAAALREDTKACGARLLERLGALPAREFERQLRGELDTFLRAGLKSLDEKGLALLKAGYGTLTELLSDKAADAGRFLAELLREEFGIDFPVPDLSFSLSSRSDFTLHLGAGGSLLLDMEAVSRLLPRRRANSRYYRRSMEQAELDIERNMNNMLSNYRYKLQESLRPLCRELTEQVAAMSAELEALISHLDTHLEAAQEERNREIVVLDTLLEQLRS